MNSGTAHKESMPRDRPRDSKTSCGRREWESHQERQEVLVKECDVWVGRLNCGVVCLIVCLVVRTKVTRVDP